MEQATDRKNILLSNSTEPDKYWTISKSLCHNWNQLSYWHHVKWKTTVEHRIDRMDLPGTESYKRKEKNFMPVQN